MYYNPEKKLVYLAHPHTASRSTVGVLEGRGFVKKKGEGHHDMLYGNGVVTLENRDEWTVFTTVRNHFDWILAQVWKVELASHPNPDIDWSDLGMWERNLNRHNYITDHTLFDRHCPFADWILHFETLKSDLNNIVGGIKPVTKMGWAGKNPNRRKRHYREFYTPDVRKWVESRFGGEMRRLGYAF